MPLPESAGQWELFCEFRVLGLGGAKGRCTRLFRSYVHVTYVARAAGGGKGGGDNNGIQRLLIC